MYKVLYAEDEEFLGKIVKESLETRGFLVRMEGSGEHVLEAYRQFEPHICVLDVMLPHTDGFALAEGIRKMDKKMPILMLTAKTQTEDVLKGFGSGANDYMRKPFSLEELIVRLKNLLAAHDDAATLQADTLLLGKLRYNIPRQVLSGGDQEKKLSFREAELLKYLHSHRNLVIDRRELLNTLWGNDSFFNSRNLDVYITKLRGYLKDDATIEILTIKGIGYRFVSG
ncbi:MAG: DNA-binding response regulator [Bacteroidetes bacterium]|nr:MAG: DNA-binding response regulator [Bacteroidota bacterium]